MRRAWLRTCFPPCSRSCSRDLDAEPTEVDAPIHSLNILGISAYYHDSAAALLRDGAILAAAQEERFSRKKHDARFPAHAITYCLDEGHIALVDLDYIVFYDKPLVKFDRLLETYIAYAPSGIRAFVKAMPIWLKEKLQLKMLLKKKLAQI